MNNNELTRGLQLLRGNGILTPDEDGFVHAAILRINQYDAYTVQLLNICKEFAGEITASLEAL